MVVQPRVVQLLEHLAEYVRALQRLAALASDELLADLEEFARAILGNINLSAGPEADFLD